MSSQINIDVKEWVPVEMTGNYKCPNCKKEMIVIPNNSFVYTYCVHCKKYFEEKREDMGKQTRAELEKRHAEYESDLLAFWRFVEEERLPSGGTIGSKYGLIGIVYAASRWDNVKLK